ncbi:MULTISPECIES: leucyl aminopeptidase [Chelativorans]|jgi:leucyl aminopeptidase|uniref:Probable cytosol aminopeptidase n=1 Tax=Chelativorans sp. (strain BNC1) TaxID=266779 RepID=AMPA_CHESB|nr:MULTISPECIES: leucyl aminopeptidase [Chelativorans]Q11HH5.1 RecName: Full=Probable cytosol aminopeptidase; AltName: Full=Leucine aminopeptidase; Short=LAP; AltName: Full=Leucyl aminopeptidase [Chelativorans sp. BNC1]
MTEKPTIAFAKFAAPKKGSVILLVPEGGNLGQAATAADPAGVMPKVFAAAEFKGKLAATVEALAPQGTAYDRVAVIGTGNPSALTEQSWLQIGGAAAAAAKNAGEVTVIADVAGLELSAREAANIGLGILLRSYVFDKYKTRRDENGIKARDKKFTIQCADPNAAKKAFAEASALGDGVYLARDLVNEPANVLGPVEFAAQAKALESLGVKVDVLTEREMKKLGMGALLGVAQGSVRPPRLVVMQWNGGKPKQKPVAFVGKGVVFDTGGISIKPAASMEDMKGDMAGAAAVVGLMHALAARKAKTNAVGIIGLVENMPDGNAQRPGDIVTSMSGQTIEIINTDAEGRLVLADALWYCKEQFKPQFMVNLATLTGAIIVALGNSHAGLFSNDDTLSERLTAAGQATGEKVWRMPLGSEYDKLIDTKNADMKNTGGRQAGSITAAQFLKRFVDDTPWAHLDVAGTAMGSPSSEINQSWASGFGVRLLDRLVADHYEG